MRIGVDAMEEISHPMQLCRCRLSLTHLNAGERIVLFGNQDVIINLLQKENVSPDKFDIIHTTEVIEMGDNPSKSFAKKPDSSIVKGFMALAAGKIDGFASAGSTGAMMVGAMMVIKQIPGVIRPAIAGFIPVSDKKVNLLLDVGIKSRLPTRCPLPVWNSRFNLCKKGFRRRKSSNLAIKHRRRG
jgi:glycerol-3-phosphate acyltransferase PlsX